MIRTHKFKAGACYSSLDGNTYRPFYLDDCNHPLYRMNLSNMLSEDKTKGDAEMVNLCECIKNATGAVISPGELPAILKSCTIEVEVEENNS